jgi:HK97 family phage prohead protease
VRFAGYAAVFDRPDSGGDVVRKGAFAEALKRASEVPLLLQHKGQPVGRIEHLSEDRRGLRVIAQVIDGRVGELVRRGLRGLSFGYRVREARSAGAMRELRALDLIEVSLVARPMQRLARMHAVERKTEIDNYPACAGPRSVQS